MSLPNLFQFLFGDDGFAVNVYTCKNCKKTVRSHNNDYCSDKDLRRLPCKCSVEDPYCKMCGNNGYAGTWFLDDITRDTHYMTPLDRQIWSPYNCHEVSESILISRRYRRDGYVCYDCYGYYVDATEPGTIRYLEAGHYTSYQPHVGACRVCADVIVRPLNQGCWKCSIAEFHNRSEYYEGKLVRCTFQYDEERAIRSRFKLPTSSPRRQRRA